MRTHEEHNRLHGYSMFIQRHSILDGYWTKPAYIQSVLLQELSKPESQRLSWLFWFDADTVVMNYKMPLETFLPPDGDDNLEDVHIIVTEDWNGLNNGVFGIRIVPDSVNLLASILAFREFRPETMLPFQDQSAMEMVLKQHNFAEHAVTVPQRVSRTVIRHIGLFYSTDNTLRTTLDIPAVSPIILPQSVEKC